MKFVCTEQEQHFEMLVCTSVSAWGHDLSTNAEQAFNRRAGWQSCICFYKYLLNRRVLDERRYFFRRVCQIIVHPSGHADTDRFQVINFSATANGAESSDDTDSSCMAFSGRRRG